MDSIDWRTRGTDGRVVSDPVGFGALQGADRSQREGGRGWNAHSIAWEAACLDQR
jgi:hypothetical protein